MGSFGALLGLPTKRQQTRSGIGCGFVPRTEALVPPADRPGFPALTEPGAGLTQRPAARVGWPTMLGAEVSDQARPRRQRAKARDPLQLSSDRLGRILAHHWARRHPRWANHDPAAGILPKR